MFKLMGKEIIKILRKLNFLIWTYGVTYFSSGEKTSEAEQMITEDLSEAHIPLSEEPDSKFTVIDEVEHDKYLSADIPDLNTNNISVLADESPTVEIESFQGILNSGNIMMIPVSNTSSVLSQDIQKLVQIVNVNGQPTFQVVNGEPTLQTTGKLISCFLNP